MPLAIPGGWRVVVAPRPESTTVAVERLVDAGSRRDGPRTGLSRLTSELVFGTPGPEHPDLLAALEAVGGEARQTTTREYASFRAVVAAPRRDLLWTLLPALARAPSLTMDALEQARATIRQEQRQHASPSALLGDLLLAGLWGDVPFARPILGDTTSLAALTAADVAAHHAAHYLPTHTVLAVAGACTLDEVRAALRPLAVVAPPPAPVAEPLATPAFVGPGALHYAAPTAVTHLAVAVPVPGLTHPDRSALRLLDYLLGRGGSSRLYRELRERRGLAYTCGSAFMPYADVGLFAAQARCAPEQASTVAELLADCLLGLATAPPDAAELRAAQRRYAGSLYRSFETNASLASILAIELLLAEWEPFEQAVARVAAVTVEELADVAARYLSAARLVRASVGLLDPSAPAGTPAT